MDVAIVTVGDELLAGETVNTNAAWIASRLRERGVTVRRISTVPDTVGAIARVVNVHRAEYDGVIVTGGLGPTHDDCTMAGVAAAFGRSLEPNEAVAEWFTDHDDYASDDLAAGTTDLPSGAVPLHNTEGVAPGCIVDSVYVLPGVPTEMKAMFESIEGEFSGPQTHVQTVVVDEPESELLDRFDRLRAQFDVTVGSYPSDVVTVKIRGGDRETVKEAADWFTERVRCA